MDDVVGRITTLISEELKASRENKEKKSGEYLLGKNEAYSKVLEEITLTLTNERFKIFKCCNKCFRRVNKTRKAAKLTKNY